MSANNIVRFYEQLRAVWRSRDKEQPFVRGYLLTRTTRPPPPLNGYNHHSSRSPGHRNSGNELEPAFWGPPEVVERWFTLLGHALFYCTSKESAEYNGAMLTDIFSPVMARVDDKTMSAFGALETQQANALYLKGMCMGELELLLCPKSADEKRVWLEKLQRAGLTVPTRNHDEKQGRTKDGREKVVVVSGGFNEALYLSSARQLVHSPTLEKSWRDQWKKAAKKALSLPDAAQVRMKFGVLQKLFESEHRYCNDLHTLVEFYYKQLKTAIISGYVNIQWEQLDAIFLNCESLLMLHKLLLSRIEACVREPSPQFGALMCQFIPHMTIYTEFIKNHDQSIKMLEACLNANPSFTDFLENHHFSHDCDAQHLRMLLHQPVTRLEIYQAFIEEVLRQTSEDHIDYRSLGSALEAVQDLKTDISKQASEAERQERMLSILKSVGPAGFILLEPECRLILESDLFLPASSKWVTGTIKRRPVLCYLYSNAVVVIAKDKKIKSRSQIFPLCGASVYEHVSRSGEVTYARDPEVEVRALKLYSPNGPRNGVVLIFLTQSNKSLWTSKIGEMIERCTPTDLSSSPIDLSPPTSRRHMRKLSLFTPPTSPPQTPVVLTGRRSSVQIGSPSTPTTTITNSSATTSSHPAAPHRVHSDKSLLTHSHSHSFHPNASRSSHSPPTTYHHLKRTQLQGLSNSTTNLLDEVPVDLSPLPGRNRKLSSSPKHARLTRAASMTSLGPDDPSGMNEIVRPRHEVYSIPSLFSLLISNPPSPHYAATFFLTYRMFTNAHEVLDAVIEGHKKELDARNSSVHTLSTESLRFFNTLKLWVNKYYVDFHHDVTLKQVLLVYLDSLKCHKCVHEKEIELADSIIKTVNDRGHIPLVRRSRLRIQIPKMVSDVPTSFADIATETMARQLTWVEHELYSRMKPYEFLQQKWTKKNKQELAPNICYVIQRFNQMTLWIGKEILSCDQPRKRCALVQKLVAIAEYCRELRNYVTIFQITAALCSSSIQRLKKTWDLVPQNVLDQFTELKQLTTIDGGSKVYRDVQKSSPSPSVPYIGPYLNQLVSIEVGMPTFVRDPPEHVNFSKLSKLGHVIEELMKFQNPKYNIEANASVLTFLERALESASGFDDEQRYSRSMQLEPQPHAINGFKKKSLSKLLST